MRIAGSLTFPTKKEVCLLCSNVSASSSVIKYCPGNEIEFEQTALTAFVETFQFLLIYSRVFASCNISFFILSS